MTFSGSIGMPCSKTEGVNAGKINKSALQNRVDILCTTRNGFQCHTELQLTFKMLEFESLQIVSNKKKP